MPEERFFRLALVRREAEDGQKLRRRGVTRGGHSPGRHPHAGRKLRLDPGADLRGEARLAHPAGAEQRDYRALSQLVNDLLE